MLPFDKYSGFNKLINVTTNIFKILTELKHVDEDPSNSAKIYLLNVMQQQSFTAEFAYLQSLQGKKVPELINNLFIDQRGMIRIREE